MNSLSDYAVNPLANNLWAFQENPFLSSSYALNEQIDQLNRNLLKWDMWIESVANMQMPYIQPQSLVPPAFENAQYISLLHNSLLPHDKNDDKTGAETLSSMGEMAESGLKVAKMFGKLSPEMESTLKGIEGFNDMSKVGEGLNALSEGSSVLKGIGSLFKGIEGLWELGEAATVTTVSTELAPETFGASLAVGTWLTSKILDKKKEEKHLVPDFSILKYMAHDSKAYADILDSADKAITTEYYIEKIRQYTDELNKQGSKIFYDPTSARKDPIPYNTAFSNVMSTGIVSGQPKIALFETYSDMHDYLPVVDPKHVQNLQYADYGAAKNDHLRVNSHEAAYTFLRNKDTDAVINQKNDIKDLYKQYGELYTRSVFVNDSTSQLYSNYSKSGWDNYYQEQKDMQAAANNLLSWKNHFLGLQNYSNIPWANPADNQKSAVPEIKTKPGIYYEKQNINTGRTITININKPLCEINGMTVKEAKEGVQDIKRMVGEAFLEILYSANAAH